MSHPTNFNGQYVVTVEELFEDTAVYGPFDHHHEAKQFIKDKKSSYKSATGHKCECAFGVYKLELIER